MSIAEQKITGYEDSISALPDKIENNAAWLKAKFDGRTDKEVKEKHNALIDALMDIAAAAEIGAAEGEAATTVQAALDDRYRKGETYSRAETDAEIEEKMTAIGAGDMAMAIYDPEGKQMPYLPAAEGLDRAAYGGSADGVVAAADTAAALGGVAAAELLAMLPPIGDITFGFYRISYPDGDVNAKTYPWVNFDDDLDPAVYPQLYALYGDSLSDGAGEGRFNLKKLSDRFPLVSTSNFGEVGGAAKVALTAENNGPHTHGISIYASYVQPSEEGGIALGNAGVTQFTSSSGAGEPHENMPPFIKISAHIRSG